MDSRKYNSQDITSKLDEIKEAIEAGGLAPSVIADAYSDKETYSVGDYVTYDAKSYRCTTAVAEAEEFDSEKWDEIKVLDELASAVELPPVTSTDNGKILSVVEGKWSKADENKVLTGILTHGQTSVTILDSSITDDAMYDIYTDVYGVNPTEVTITTGSIVLTFEEQLWDVSIKVVIK